MVVGCRHSTLLSNNYTMMNPRRGRTQLSTTGLNLLAIMLSSTVMANALEISLQANESIATQLGYDDILYFQPESPPSSDMMCSEQCPCPDDDGSNGGSCWCDLEMVCGGSIPLDLSSSSNNADGDNLKIKVRLVNHHPSSQLKPRLNDLMSRHTLNY